MGRVQLNQPNIDALLHSRNSPLRFDLEERTRRVALRAVGLAPHLTGRLGRSIFGEVQLDERGLFGIVGTALDYSLDVELGTGLFSTVVGPHLIRPVTAPAMVFFWNGQWHRRTTVGGQRPQPFLVPALEAARG